MEQTQAGEVTEVRKTVVIVLVAGAVVIAAVAVFVPEARIYATETAKTFLGAAAGVLK